MILASLLLGEVEYEDNIVEDPAEATFVEEGEEEEDPGSIARNDSPTFSCRGRIAIRFEVVGSEEDAGGEDL